MIRPVRDEFGRTLMLRPFSVLPLDLAPWEGVSGLPIIDGKGMTPERLAELPMGAGPTLVSSWWQNESYFYGEHQAIREASTLAQTLVWPRWALGCALKARSVSVYGEANMAI